MILLLSLALVEPGVIMFYFSWVKVIVMDLVALGYLWPVSCMIMQLNRTVIFLTLGPRTIQWDDKCRIGNLMHRVGRLLYQCSKRCVGNPFGMSRPSLKKGVRGPSRLDLSGSQGPGGPVVTWQPAREESM